MARRDIEAGRAFVRVSMNDTAFVRGIRRAQMRLQSFGKAGIATGAAFTGAGAAILAPLGLLAQQFAATGDQAGKMAARTGVAAEAIQELAFAAEQSGASAETLEKGFAGLSRTYLEAKRGSAVAVDALNEIGLSFKDIQNLQPDEQFAAIAEGIAKISNESIRGAAAQNIFGRAGRQLLPLLKSGAEGIAALRQEARDLNIPLTNEEVAAAEALTDAMNRLKRSIGTAKNLIGSAIAEPLSIASTTIAKVAAITGRWIRQNRQLFAGLAAGGVALVAIGGAIGAVGIAATVASFALGGLLSLMGAMGTILGAITSPLGLVIVALSAGAVAWAKWTAGGRAFVAFAQRSFGQAFATIKTTLAGIYDALAGGDLELAGKIAMVGLKLVFAEGINAIASLVGGQAGETLRTVWKQLWEGDLSGAIETMFLAAKTAAINWGAGMVATMATVTGQLVELWRKASEKISQMIYKIAEQLDPEKTEVGIASPLASLSKRFGDRIPGGDSTLGRILSPASGIGRDLKNELDNSPAAAAKRAAELDDQLRERHNQMRLAGLEVDQHRGNDPNDAIKTYFDELQKTIDAPIDAIAAANASLMRDAQNKLDEHLREVGQINTDDLAAQLEALRADAAKAREAARLGATPDNENLAAMLDEQKQRTFGATSAAAVAALAATSSSPQQRLLTVAEKQVRKLTAIVVNGEKTVDALRNFGVKFE